MHYLLIIVLWLPNGQVVQSGKYLPPSVDGYDRCINAASAAVIAAQDMGMVAVASCTAIGDA